MIGGIGNMDTLGSYLNYIGELDKEPSKQDEVPILPTKHQNPYNINDNIDFYERFV